MVTPLTLDATEVLDLGPLAAEEDFELDVRVVEATTPLAAMTCDSSNGCGSTCSTSACSSSSYDPI